MILFIFGPDSFRSKQKLKEVCDIIPETFDARITEYSVFKSNVTNISLFDKKKILVIEDIFDKKSKEFKELFIENFEALNKSEHTIIVYDNSILKQTGRDKLLKLLLDKAEMYFFSEMYPATVKKWIKDKVESYDKKIDNAGISLLYSYYQKDLWRLDNEIGKLVCFTDSITEKDVKILSRPNFNSNIFDTIDAIAKKEKSNALNLIFKHMSNDNNAIYILAMIASTFKTLLIIKELSEKNKTYEEILSITKLHPFFAGKSYKQSQQFSYTELKNIYRRIFKADFNIKTGRIDPAVALELLVLGI